MLWADVILVGAEFFFRKWFLHNPPAITLQNKVSQCKIWAIVYLLTYLIDKIPSCALGIQKILKDFLHEAHLIVLACMDPGMCSKTRLG